MTRIWALVSAENRLVVGIAGIFTEKTVNGILPAPLKDDQPHAEDLNMSIKTLQFCEPFYIIKAVQDEKEYKIGNKSIVVNLSETDIMVKNKPVNHLKSSIVTNVTINNLQRAIIVEDYERNTHHAKLFEDIKNKWPIVYDVTKLERHKGVLLWRSSKERIFGNTDVNLFYIAANVSTGPHKTHPQKITEVHTQILGVGKIQKMEENDYSTLYQEVIMAPGITHDLFCDEQGVYPWHQYQSVTESIFMPVEIC